MELTNITLFITIKDFGIKYIPKTFAITLSHLKYEVLMYNN